MRAQIFTGVFLTALILSIPVTASAEDEVIANCPADPKSSPPESLTAYGSVSGGRLYLKKVEMKVGTVTITPPLPGAVEFGYLDQSTYSVIRTHPLPPQGSRTTYSADKLNLQIDRLQPDVRDMVRDLVQTSMDSFSIEANPNWGFQVTVSGLKPWPGGGGSLTSNDMDFSKCTLSQSAKDALDAAHLNRVAKKTGTAGPKLTLTVSAAPR